MRYEGYVARATASSRYPKEVKARNGIANHRNMANILFEKCQRAIATSPRIPNKESRGAQYEIRVVPEQKSQPFSHLALAEIQYINCFNPKNPGQNSFPVLTQRDGELTLTGPSTFIVIFKCINGFFSVEFNIPTDTPGDGSVPAVQGHSKKRIFGRKYIMELTLAPHSLLPIW